MYWGYELFFLFLFLKEREDGTDRIKIRLRTASFDTENKKNRVQYKLVHSYSLTISLFISSKGIERAIRKKKSGIKTQFSLNDFKIVQHSVSVCKCIYKLTLIYSMVVNIGSI